MIDADVRDRDDAAAICAAVFDLIRPDVDRMGIDVYSDYRDDEMPPEVLAAQRRLTESIRRRHTKRADISLVVTPDEAEWADAEVYAPWSIDVVVYGRPSVMLACLHDCASSVVVELTEVDAAVLRDRVAHLAPLVLLADVHRRRREDRRRARAARRTERRAALQRLLHLQ